MLAAAATTFSFGLNEKSDPANERHLLYTFVAYLKLVLDEETYNMYIPPDVSEESKHADGLKFGRPVWDFTYPESSFFLTEIGLIGGYLGLAPEEVQENDVISIFCGCNFPVVLRPCGDNYLLIGECYVDGIMDGEVVQAKEQGE